MAIPQTAYTLDALALKVADRLGVSEYRSDGTEILPVTNKFNFGKCIEMVQRGIGLLIDAAPVEGWHWKKRSYELEFDSTGAGSDNIDSDPARYMLPVEFGGELKGDIRYAANSNHGTQIEWCAPRIIKDLRADYITNGYPTKAAVLPYQPTSTSGTGRRWELIVDPSPSANLTIEFDYILHFDSIMLHGGVADSASNNDITDATFATTHPVDDFFNNWYIEIIDGTGRGSYAQVIGYTGSTGKFDVDDWLDPGGNAGGTDPAANSVFIVKPDMPYYHPVGFSYDNIVEVACFAATEMFGRSQVTDDHFTSMFYNLKIKEAHNINRRQIPRRVGRLTRGRWHRPHRNWFNVTTDHDV